MDNLYLSNYYDNTKLIYDFFDALFKIKRKNSGKSKEDVLSDLGISFSTYRGKKSNGIMSNEYLDILLKYFTVELPNYNYKNKYESCIRKIYYKSLYKSTDDLKLYLDEIENYINHNNLIKPIFVLMKIFGYINLPYTYDELKSMLDEDIQYIKHFNEDFFYDEFKVIFLCVLTYFRIKYNFNDISEILKINRRTSGVYYQIKASVSYLNKNDYEALIYYQKALQEYEKENIHIRVVISINNIALIYNNLNEYKLALDNTYKVINYIYSDYKILYISYLLQHHFLSLLMLEKYKEIIGIYSSLSDYSIFTPTSIVILIIALYINNREDEINDIYSNFIGNKNVDVVMRLITKLDYNILNDFSNLEQFIAISNHIKKTKMLHKK